MSQPESIQAVIAKDPQAELLTLKKLSVYIFENGAILSCAKCGRTKEKTAEEMAAYLKHWPRCCGWPAEVKAKIEAK